MIFIIAVIAVGVLVATTIPQMLSLRIKNYCLRNAVGFFHPASGGGGGGERVLWVAIKALQDADIAKGIQRKYVLYTKSYPASLEAKQKPSVSADLLGVKASANDIQLNLLERVKAQFGIEIPRPLDVKILSDSSCAMLDGSKYPRLTLVLQTVVGGLLMFYEVALANNCCGTIVDTVGVPFLYPLLRIFCGTTIVTYTHYPSISSDMIGRVESRESTYNNNSEVASSTAKTTLKLWYYYAFSCFYWMCGQFVTETMCNSSWTRNHIQVMWGTRKKRHLVFPPCNVNQHLANNEAYTVGGKRKGARSDKLVVSVAQFRPEKDHSLQLRAFAKFLAMPKSPKGVKLILAGGARNKDDLQRVDSLKAEAKKLGLIEGVNVDFAVSIPYSRIVELLGEATVGLHTMTDEHFGIAVVEYLAAGAIPLAHNSAGPKMDIVTSEEIGYVAKTEDEFAEKLGILFDASVEKRNAMRAAGVQKALQFTDEAFGEQFVAILYSVLQR